MQNFPIKCRLATNVNGAPKTIMVLPSGTHTISATKSGRPYKTTVNVTPTTAAVLQSSLAAMNADRFPHRVWFDFDHQDSGPAAAWPVRFYWKDGADAGVYCELEWSKAGEEAVTGRSYRAFSPSFFADGASPVENVSGLAFCAGSLVNAPAFRKIAPLWASDFDVPRIGSRLTLAGIVGNPARIESIHGDVVTLKTRLGERLYMSPSRLLELV